MFSQSATVRTGQNNSTTDSMEFSVHSDYYGGDFVEDGSFLVLNTDGLSLSPTTPPEDRSADEEEKQMDIELLNCVDDDEPANNPNSSIVSKSSSLAQVLGEDPESSVEDSKPENQKAMSINTSLKNDAEMNSITNMSLASASSSSSTDAQLIESGEEVSLLMAENKKLAELLVDSNEKMKQCIVTTEKLKTDHEEYKKKNEASREIIVQLRQENEVLKSQTQVSTIQSATTENQEIQQNVNNDSDKTDSLQRQLHTISELNDRLETVLTVNGQLNDQLLKSQKTAEMIRAELETLQSEKSEAFKKIEVMRAEIETGRQTIAKFNEHRMKNESDLQMLRMELSTATDKIHRLESVVEEKTKLTESLRRNMEDTVTALERCNQKLNQKEEEVILLTTQIAALAAESDNAEHVQVLEVQCQTYLADFEKEREERAKLAAEKEALLAQLNLVTRQLREKSDALDNSRRPSRPTEIGESSQREYRSRNDNPAVNSNEPLQSPLTSLPSVAGHLVGFVRREILGWEDQLSGNGDGNPSSLETPGSTEAVVQQPKQEGIPPCPLCRKSFATLDKLQRHASSCGIERVNFGEPSDEPFVFP